MPYISMVFILLGGLLSTTTLIADTPHQRTSVTIALDGNNLTPERVEKIAQGLAEVQIDEKAMQRVQKSYDVLM
jgi:CO/xanthine dehydrogenase FAD-binding subunit